VTAPRGTQARPPLWRDVRVLRALLQVMAIVLVVLSVYILWFNVTNNLRAQGIRTDFGFLNQPFGVPILDANFDAGSPIRRALLVGIKNTFALAVVGIPLLSVIGLLIGVARLSTNWLVSKAATLYVEVFRNLPPLLIIVFAFRAVVLRLPPPRDPATPLDLFVISNLRITVPGFVDEPGAGAFRLVMLGLLVGAALLWWWRTRLHVRTGAPLHRALWSLGLVLVGGTGAYLLMGRPIGLTIPVLDGRLIVGGFSGLGSYFAVMGALVLYTASHVAEIVRGSIQAVPKGQTEAAGALALTSLQRLRFVILPQALRIAIPPTINQYLNYVKNTSLAIVVAYADVVLIAFQAIGNGQPAPQLILMVMAAYLLFSLSISLMVNYLNRRLQFVTH